MIEMHVTKVLQRLGHRSRSNHLKIPTLWVCPELHQHFPETVVVMDIRAAFNFPRLNHCYLTKLVIYLCNGSGYV